MTPNVTKRPTGSTPGKSCRAADSLSSATGSPPSPSADVKPRPATTGTPAAAKYPESAMVVYICGGVSASRPSATTVPTASMREGWKGSDETIPAARTPRAARIRSSIASARVSRSPALGFRPRERPAPKPRPPDRIRGRSPPGGRSCATAVRLPTRSTVATATSSRTKPRRSPARPRPPVAARAPRSASIASAREKRSEGSSPTERRPDRRQEREREDPEVHRDRGRAREVGREHPGEGAQSGPRQRDAAHAAQQRDRRALREEMAEETASLRPQCRTNRQLSATLRAAREQEPGHVRARHQEEEAHRAQQHEDRGSHRREHLLTQPDDFDVQQRAVAELLPDRGVERSHLRPRR